jgi:flagellar biosynthesis/type III secretory pathway protein FliH
MLRRLTRVLLLAFGLTAISLTLAACSHHYGYRSPYGPYARVGYTLQQAYRTGYEQGLEHGQFDRRSGLRYEFRDSKAYRMGISHDPRVNEAFRNGYEDGYRNGFYQRRNY